jgi:hypothetical protein
MPLVESDLFCPYCGRGLNAQTAPLPPPPPYYPYYPSYPQESVWESLKRAGRGITSISLLPLLVLLAVNVVILIWGSSLVFPETASHGNTLFIILPLPNPIVDLVDLTGPAFAAYQVFLVVSITVCFVWMVYKSYKPFQEELAFKTPQEGHSPLYTIGTVFFAVLAFNAAYVIILSIFQVQMNTPDFGSKELWQLLHGLASASVWEELVSRVLLIGVPLLVIDSLMKRRKKTRSYFLGGGFELGGKELVLIFASSGIFALGHIVYWDAWKILPSWVAGIAFGYLFLRLGLYASIMLHFTIDYLTIPMEVSGSVLVTLLLGLVLLLWEVLGGIYLVVYVYKIANFLTGKDLKPRPAPAPRPAPSAYGPTYPPPGPGTGGGPSGPGNGGGQPPGVPPPIGTAPAGQGRGFFICSQCGNTQAIYKDGMLECTRCHHRQ